MEEQADVQENSQMQMEDSKDNEPELLLEEAPELLTEEEKLFLEEHIYGQWRFADRIVEIDENNNTYYGASANISDVGVEELKKIVVIAYEEKSVWFPVEIGQNSFSYAQDMYLFAAHGGFLWSRKPIYKINEMDTDMIVLKDMFSWNYRYEVQIPGWEDYIHVTYAPEDHDSMQIGNIFSLFGSSIYVNPNDTDTIYIDFCGLWKMTRDDAYYGTDGKSEY